MANMMSALGGQQGGGGGGGQQAPFWQQQAPAAAEPMGGDRPVTQADISELKAQGQQRAGPIFQSPDAGPRLAAMKQALAGGGGAAPGGSPGQVQQAKRRF